MDRTRSFSWAVVVVLGMTPTVWSGPDPADYILSIHPTSAHCEAGEVYGVEVRLEVLPGAAPVVGFSYGICHDPNQVQLMDVKSGMSLQGLCNGANPTFNDIQELPEGFTHAAVFSFVDLCGLGPGCGYRLAHATYVCNEAMNTIGAQCFCDTIGLAQPVPVTLTVEGGVSVKPTQVCEPRVCSDRGLAAPFGIVHRPVGRAELRYDGADLQVHNLSSEDGVEIDLGGAEGIRIEFAGSFDPAGAATGASQRLLRTYFDFLGERTGDSSLTMTDNGDRIEIAAQLFSRGPRTIRVFNDGRVVAEVAGHDGPWDLQWGGAVPRICEPWDCDGYICCWREWCIDTNDFQNPDGGGSDESPAVPVELPGGRVVHGDAFLILPDHYMPMPTAYQSIRLTADHTDTMTIADEKLLHFGLLPLSGDHPASYTAGSDYLVVDNMARDDKFEIDLPPADGARRVEIRIDPTHSSREFDLVARADGGGGQPDRPLLTGRVYTDPTSSAVQVESDFSALGVSTYSVRLFHGESLVLEEGGQSGPACSVPAVPDVWTMGPPTDTGAPQVVAAFSGGPVPVRPSGQRTDTLADRIVMTPDLSAGQAIPPPIAAIAIKPLHDRVLVRDVRIDRMWAFGLRHRRLGDAKLRRSARDHLVVSNIGASGDDGVEIDLGAAEGMVISFASEFDPARSPEGTFHRTTRHYIDAAGETIATAENLLENVGGKLRLSSTFDRSRARTIELYRDGERVAQVPGHTGPWDLQIHGAMSAEAKCEFLDCNTTFYDFTEDLTVETPSGEHHETDSFRVRPDDYEAMGASQVIEFRGRGMLSISIDDEALVALGGFVHRPVGRTQMTARDDRLVVSNIGASGDDGVCMEIGDRNAVNIEIPVDDLQMTADSTLAVLLGGGDSGRGLRCQLAPSGGLEVRYEQQSAFKGKPVIYTVDLYLGDELVGRRLGTGDEGVVVPAGPLSFEVFNYSNAGEGGAGSNALAYAAGLSSLRGPMAVLLPGDNEPITADRILVLPDEPPVPPTPSDILVLGGGDGGIILKPVPGALPELPGFTPPPVENLECIPRPESQLVLARWTNPVLYEEILVYVNGQLAATLPGDAEMYVAEPVFGVVEICVVGVRVETESDRSCCRAEVPGGAPEFVRGDCNTDGLYNIADAIAMLGFLFGGNFSPSCLSACDSNDDGGNDIADPIATLNGLFQTGVLPPAPHPHCGVDPTDDALTCASYDACN